MTDQPVYFVHISDTHFGPTPGYTRHGHHPLSCAQRLVDRLNMLPTPPDFVVHTGDVTTDPETAAYALAAETFRDLRWPIYYVNGNHDRAQLIRHYLPMGPKEELGDDPDALAYRFEVKGYRFLVLDARGPDAIDPHGVLPASQLALLRQELAAEGPPLLLFIHFPLIGLNSPWMDANMLVLNGEEVHQVLRQRGDRLQGVFHGHVHQNMQTVRDGVLYVAVASAFSQFAAWPGDLFSRLDTPHPPGFNFIHLLPDRMIIHQHLFERP